MNQVKGTGKSLYSLLNLTKENPSRTVEIKIKPTSYILLGMYSPRNADMSVPQFFHFLTWGPYSPQPGAWSRVKGAVFWSDSGSGLGKSSSPRLRISSCCSNVSLGPEMSMNPTQNLKIVSLLTTTYPLFPNSSHHLSSGKGSCCQILRTPAHLWGLMFNLDMTVLCQDESWVRVPTSTSLVGCGNQSSHTLPPHQESKAASPQSCRQTQFCHWSPPLASSLQATALGTAGFMEYLLSGMVKWKCEYERYKYKKAQNKHIF